MDQSFDLLRKSRLERVMRGENRSQAVEMRDLWIDSFKGYPFIEAAA